MLTASLPALTPGVAVPIGRERLRARLQLLDPRHRALLDAAGAMLDSIDAGSHDEQAAQAAAQSLLAQAHIKFDGAGVVRCLESILSDQTLVAALRRRAAGREAPSSGWGFGGHRGAVTGRWTQPRFGLDVAVPWMAAAERLLRARDAAGLQALLDSRCWRAAATLRAAEPFGFGAVFGWWLQWRLLERRRLTEDDARVASRWRELLARATSPA